MVISSHSLTLPVSGTLRPCYTDSFLGCSLQNVAMEAAREGEFDLFSLVISFSVPKCESIPRKQKTVRCRWSIMNTEILEKKSKSLYWRNVNTHSQNAFWQERKQRQISEKKKGTPYRFERFRVRFELNVQVLNSVFSSTLKKTEFYVWSQFWSTLPSTRSNVPASFAKEWLQEREHPMNFHASLKIATEELHWNICL